MPDLKLSPTRAALLRGVAAGEVFHERNWDIRKPNPDVWKWMAGASRKVTADMAKLREIRLVRIGHALSASAFSSQVWEVTEAGAQWLANNPEHQEF